MRYSEVKEMINEIGRFALDYWNIVDYDASCGDDVIWLDDDRVLIPYGLY